MTHAAAVEGAERAAAHADRVTPKWSDIALEYLRAFMRAKGRAAFMTEDVRMAADRGTYVPPAPDARAWGAVILRAKRLGWLVHAGYAPNKDPSCHGSPKSVWRAA